MSLVVLSGLGLGALYYGEKKAQVGREKAKSSKPRETIAHRYTTTGGYGDISELANLIGQPGAVVGEERGYDLQGMPCRWLRLSNQCVYRTYDMKTQYL